MRRHHLIMSVSSIFIALLLFGCSSSAPFVVKVDSISEPGTNKKTYVLVPGDNNIRPNDLQFGEFARYVSHALAKRGFVRAELPETANTAIFFSYGIGDPDTRNYTYSVPIFGQTRVSSSHTTGTVSSYGGSGTFSGTTTYTPTYGVTGSLARSDSYDEYFRFMILDAVDMEEYKKTGKISQLWKTTVTSKGLSDDLRRVFPVLVAASAPYIATNTGKKYTIELDEDDKRIIEIKAMSMPEKNQR